MSGLKVLDIGCNAGFYSIALARRGAQVLGIDVDEHYLRQARWAREQLRSLRDQLALRQMHVYELGRLQETFDVVLFLGVLYHLRYPLLALDMVVSTVARPARAADPDDAGRGGDETPLDLAIDGATRCSHQAGRRWRSSSTGWPATRRTGGRPTAPASRRCCADGGPGPVGPPGHEITLARRTAALKVPADLRAVLRDD